jgi:hypothetical protein
MKVKTWHIGCLVVLVLAALYFLVGSREGLANSNTCWEDVLDASSGKFLTFTHELNTIMDNSAIFAMLDEAKTACASDTSCKGVVGGEHYVKEDETNPKSQIVRKLMYTKYYGSETIEPVPMSPLPPPNRHTYYRKKPCAGSSSSSSASASPSATDDPKCPIGAPGISSVTLTGGQKVRLYTAGECSAMGGNFAANGARNWGMANDSVGECTGTSNGINVGFCNQSAPPSAAAQAAVSPSSGMGSTAPMPPGPTGTAGGASMTPAVPSPTPSTASYPAYSLTCMAAPVSGMKGSVGMPETPAVWNVNQPSPGWNSKYGYHPGTDSGGMAGGVTSSMMAGISPTSTNIGTR